MAFLRLCSIHGCGKGHYCRGWCSAHYSRWYKTGNAETPKSHENGSAMRFFREVVVPYEGEDCLFWPFSSNGRYGFLWHQNRQRYVHRVLCEEVYGSAPSSKHQVRHLCGKGHLGCVNKRHLAWGTAKENAADRETHGMQPKGERSPRSKLTPDQVREIRKTKTPSNISEISEKFGIGRTQIYRICSGQQWSCLD